MENINWVCTYIQLFILVETNGYVPVKRGYDILEEHSGLCRIVIYFALFCSNLAYLFFK